MEEMSRDKAVVKKELETWAVDGVSAAGDTAIPVWHGKLLF